MYRVYKYIGIGIGIIIIDHRPKAGNHRKINKGAGLVVGEFASTILFHRSASEFVDVSCYYNIYDTLDRPILKITYLSRLIL